VPCAGFDGKRDCGPGEANLSPAVRESAGRNEGSSEYSSCETVSCETVSFAVSLAAANSAGGVAESRTA